MAVVAEVNGQQITFDVVLDIEGDPSLRATHINGEPNPGGFLLTVRKDGRFEREIYVDEAFGFKLNSEGQIKQYKGE